MADSLKTIGGFEILEEIQAGSGSQGTVYKARCVSDVHGFVSPGTVVALKVMPVQDEGGSLWRKLEKRTKELVQLDHPNVVRYHGCFSESGMFNDLHVVVQEFLEGDTLKARLLSAPNGLDADEALRIVKAALSGLVYVSGKGIVHRDIKPGNIFLCSDGGVKLIDFEIAKRNGGTTTASAGNIRGSFDYMAPDFTVPDFYGDVRSDVFSTGVVLHEMLTGKTPYRRLEGDDKQANFAFLSRWTHVLQEGEDPIRISVRIKRILSGADVVLKRALSPDRSGRYADFSSFANDVAAIKFRQLQSGSLTYRLLQYVGKGGFGEVFKARELRSRTDVAIKHLLKPEYAARFRREAKVMMKLRGSCFVRFVDFFFLNVGGNHDAFLVMAFLDGMPGSSLRDAIRKSAGSGLPLRDVLVAFECYAYGLATMHGAGLFHRDIKPSNLYFPPGRPEHAAIMDLGIARDIYGTATHGQVPGTLDYMPPEVVLSDSRGDGAMDVYALGLCFYEALTGKTAYDRLPAGTAAYSAFFARAKEKSLPVLTSEPVSTDPDLLALIREMTNPDVSDRLKDAGRVSARIREIRLERYPETVQRPTPPEESEERTEAPTQPLAPTLATGEFGAVLDAEIGAARAKRIFRRILGTVSVLILIAAIAGVAWRFGVPFFRQRVEAVRRQRVEVESCIATLSSVFDATGRFDRKAYDALSQYEIPDRAKTDGKVVSLLSAAGIAVSDRIRDLAAVEPVSSRKERFSEAEALLAHPMTQKALSTEEIVGLRRLLDAAAATAVFVVSNACSEAVAVDGRDVPPGGVTVVSYPDGRSEKGRATRPGYKSVVFPPAYRESSLRLTDELFDPLPVRVEFPPLADGVTCRFRGAAVAAGTVVHLPTGSYSCVYAKTRCAPQTVAFTVQAGVPTAVPPPREWTLSAEWTTPVSVTVPVLEGGVTCVLDGRSRSPGEVALLPGDYAYSYRRAGFETQTFSLNVAPAAPVSLAPPTTWTKTRETLARERAERLRNLRAEFDRETENLFVVEPVETRLSRIEAAEKALRDAVATADVLSAAERSAFEAKIASARRSVAGKVRNASSVSVRVAGREIVPGATELMVFDNGLPADWSVSAPGYRPYALTRVFEGKTLTVVQSDLKPAKVKVSAVESAPGIECLYDGQDARGGLELYPGSYSVVYRRKGHREQVRRFEVRLGEPTSMPRPAAWEPLPVNVSCGVFPADVVCTVDGQRAASGAVLTLMPGSHTCAYARTDYRDQSSAFEVAVGLPTQLPPPGAWTPSDAFAALIEAETAVKAGDWGRVGDALAKAGVSSPENVRRRTAIREKLDAREKLGRFVEDALVYYDGELYYDAVRCFHDAVKAGYSLSAEEKAKVSRAYRLARERLQLMIKRCHREIGIGKTPIRPVDDLEEELKQLLQWWSAVSR